MNRGQKSPQQKKRESYAKDRRNVYGENAKASRKAIPRRKAIELRALRRVSRALIGEATAHADLDQLETLESRVEGKRRRGWRKVADQPLGVVIPLRLARRARQANRKAGRPADLG